MQIWGVASHGYMTAPAPRNKLTCDQKESCGNVCLVHQNVLHSSIPAGYMPCTGFNRGQSVGDYAAGQQVSGGHTIVAGHGGAAKFFVCDDGSETIECFHRNPVQTVSTPDSPTTTWAKVPTAGCCGRHNTSSFDLVMPNLNCPSGRCTLLWEWHNSGVGDVPPEEDGGHGCKESHIFFNCADISISSDEPYPGPSPSPGPEPYPTPTPPPPPPPPASNPWNLVAWPGSSQVCLDVAGGDVRNGARLQTWACNGMNQQQWEFENWQIKLKDNNFCVDIPGGEFMAGNALQLWDCNGMPGQQWGYDYDSLSVYASASAGMEDATYCLDIQGGSSALGSSVWIWNCNHDLPQQKWYVPPSFGTKSIQSMMDNAFLCLDLLGQYTFNGNAIGAWDCNGFEGQSWIFDVDNQNIRWAKDTSKCIDIPGGDFSSGNNLWIWDCNGGDSQKFGYDIDMMSIYASASTDASMCIDVPRDEGQGAAVWLWDCNGANQQMWKVPDSYAWRNVAKTPSVV